MYNEKKIKLFKRLLILGGILAFTTVGFGLGQMVPGTQQSFEDSKAKIEKEQESIQEKKELVIDEVETFLIAYYTKRDLGENRNRYQPLMTETMFQQETSNEELPINQAYKGYVINQVFDEATIYIDPTTSIAIAEIRYHNTQLLEKDSTTGALIDTPVQETLKISFVEQNGKFLVNSIEHVLLTSTGLKSSSNTYQEVEYPEELDPESTETSNEKAPVNESEEAKTETKETVASDEEIEGDI